jgi:N4-gp56 family major capsid protein
MASTQFLTGDPQTVKVWADSLYYDAVSDKTLVGQLISNGILVNKEELNKGAGDQIKIDLAGRIISKGSIGMQPVTGNEVALSFYQDTIDINGLRIAVNIPNTGTIDAQRVKFDLPDTSYEMLRNWYSDRMTLSAMNQLAGYTATSISWDGLTYTGTDRIELTGMQTAVAPTGTNRIIRANGLATDQAVAADATATFKLSLIDDAVSAANKNQPTGRYIGQLAGGNIKYHCYVHVDQFKQIVQDTTAPQQFREIMLAKIASGQTNAALIGQSLEYNQTLIVATDKIPNGVNSGTSAAEANARRAVFTGRDAGSIAFGMGYSAGGETTPGFSFYEDILDGGAYRQITASCVHGIKKHTFNSVDNGTIVLTTYVA